MTVYICTRNRRKNLEKILPRWFEQDIPVVLVVENSEYQDTIEFSTRLEGDVFVACLTKENMGIGYARAYAVSHAFRHGHESIIMSDDDIRPAKNSNMYLLIEEAAKPKVLGVGAALRIQDHFTHGAITKNSGVILCPGSWGGRLYGLNVESALNIGNFDTRLDCAFEDDELKRNGIAISGVPWLVHCDVWAESIGSRRTSGGVSDLIARTSLANDLDQERIERELRCHKIVYTEWPEYVSKPPARMRMAWQRILDDYIPGWRARSALHGGHW